jgi:PIN domain nuclease of toxin-antitoxin system
LDLSIADFDAETAEQAAQPWIGSRAYGLSLDDCACIAGDKPKLLPKVEWKLRQAQLVLAV